MRLGGGTDSVAGGELAISKSKPAAQPFFSAAFVISCGPVDWRLLIDVASLRRGGAEMLGMRGVMREIAAGSGVAGGGSEEEWETGEGEMGRAVRAESGLRIAEMKADRKNIHCGCWVQWRA